MKVIRTGLVVLVGLLVLPYTVEAQSGGPYVLEWSTIDGGGGQSSGGPYVLTGTIGQPDAAYSSGGKFELLGGFWPGGPLYFVEFDDFARFADYWLATGAGLPADLYEDGAIDWLDLRQFTYDWLYECPYRWPLR
ncbi:MAG: hypothetical protein ACYTBJ_23145 [Planctomycetota bacterium]|jgi:hypothetical protein